MELKIKDPDFLSGIFPIELEVKKSEAEAALAKFPPPECPKTGFVEQVSELPAGSKIRKMLMLAVEVEEDVQNGELCLSMRCVNAKGAFWAKLADADGKTGQKGRAKAAMRYFKEQSCAYVDGTVDGEAQKTLEVERIYPFKGEVNPFDVLPSRYEKIADMAVELLYYINELKQPHKDIALKALERHWSDLASKPASAKGSYAYLGGLLEHTLGVVRVARWASREEDPASAMLRLLAKAHRPYAMSVHERAKSRKAKWGSHGFDGEIGGLHRLILGYAESAEKRPLNADLLVAAAVWHDIGKIFKYTHIADRGKFSRLIGSEPAEEKKSAFEEDAWGSLIGHEQYAAALFLEAAKDCASKPSAEQLHEYLHAISAAGQREPALPSAWILRFADRLDESLGGAW